MAPRGKTFQVRWREGGVHRQRSFPTLVLKKKFEAELRLKVYEVADDRAARITFSELCERWLKDYSEIQCAESTTASNARTIRNYLIPSFGHLKLSEIRRTHGLEFQARVARQTSAATANLYLSIASKILTTAVEWEVLGKNPFQRIKALKVVKKAFNFWTAEERDRFLRFAKAGDRPLYRLCLVAVMTGMRLGEIRALRRGQLDFDRRLIRIEATFNHHLGKRLERTKNGRVEWIPMPEVIADELKEFKLAAAEAPVFENKGFFMTYHRFKAAAERYGVSVLRFHDLRHTFASILVMAGVPLYTVQRLMRHKTIAMTERYAHLAPDHLREAMEVGCAPSVRATPAQAANSP